MTTPEERAATAETALAEALARVAVLEEALENIVWNAENHAHYDTGKIARAALRGTGG